jgi:hypothetical protein
VDRALREPRRGGDALGAPIGVQDLAGSDRRDPADEEVNRADQIVERGADRLEQLAGKAAAKGGVQSKVAETLAEDAAFLRKLKPSLIAARARGQAPTDQEPGSTPTAPAGPQLGARPKPGRTGGPNPFVVIGAALAVGILLAKLIDWRGHAHPRD